MAQMVIVKQGSHGSTIRGETKTDETEGMKKDSMVVV